MYLQTNGDQSYFVEEGQGAKAAGAKLGVTVKVENENNSSATTISDIQSAIAAKVDGLIVVAPSASLGPRMTSLAQKAGIPIMASDNGFADAAGKQVPFVGINAKQFGENSGKLLAQEFRTMSWTSDGTYALVYVVKSLPTCNDRTNAEETALQAAGFPKANIIEVPYDGTTQKAQNNTGPVATAHPDAKHWLLTGCNDDGVVGGVKALGSHGVAVANIAGVGLGGDLACQVWSKGAADIGFRATNYIYANQIGAQAVQAMYEHVANGKPFPPNTYVSPIPITKANYTKTVKC